jgi:hypothetical protein
MQCALFLNCVPLQFSEQFHEKAHSDQFPAQRPELLLELPELRPELPELRPERPELLPELFPEQLDLALL